MGEIKFAIAITMIALFSIAIIGFAVKFGDVNDAQVKLGDDEGFVDASADINQSMKDLSVAVNSSMADFSSSTANPGDDVSTSGQQFKVTLPSLIGVTISTLKTGYEKIFGSDSEFGIFLTALFFLIGFLALRYAYKSWFGKNPD